MVLKGYWKWSLFGVGLRGLQVCCSVQAPLYSSLRMPPALLRGFHFRGRTIESMSRIQGIAVLQHMMVSKCVSIKSRRAANIQRMDSSQPRWHPSRSRGSRYTVNRMAFVLCSLQTRRLDSISGFELLVEVGFQADAVRFCPALA